jgi:hypothetical protein
MYMQFQGTTEVLRIRKWQIVFWLFNNVENKSPRRNLSWISSEAIEATGIQGAAVSMEVTVCLQ